MQQNISNRLLSKINIHDISMVQAFYSQVMQKPTSMFSIRRLFLKCQSLFNAGDYFPSHLLRTGKNKLFGLT